MENEVKEIKPIKAKKKFQIKFVLLPILLGVGGYFAYTKINYAMHHESTDNAQVDTQIVPVLPRISGYVKVLNIKDYDSIKAGEVVMELDDAELQSQLAEQIADYNQATVDIVNAKASLNQTNTGLGVNRGNIDISNTRKQKALADYTRDQKLYAAEAITKKQLDDSKYNYELAIQQTENTTTELTAASSKTPVAEANVQKAESVLAVKLAKIEQTKLKISYCKIIAPTTGKIGKKVVSIGQYVQAGTPMFSIVNDSTYWVIANFKENQIRTLYPGKLVAIGLDAYPKLKITGTVESLSDATGAKFALLPPDNSSGNFVKVTQRVPVKIAIKNIDQYKDILRAGLSASVVLEIE